MKVLPRREFEEAIIPLISSEEEVSLEEAIKEAKGTAGYHSSSKGVFLPKGVSTSVRLHELGHEAYGHGYETSKNLRDIIFEEIEAEIYSWENRGKEVTYRVGIEAVKQLVHDHGYTPKEAVYWVSLHLVEDFNISVSKEDKKDLLALAKKVDR